MTPFEFLVVALAGAYIIYVMVYAGIAAPYRNAILRMAFRWRGTGKERLGLKLQALSTCPYCTGFWVMWGIQVIFRFSVFQGLGGPGVVITHLALTYVASALAYIAGDVLNVGERD